MPLWGKTDAPASVPKNLSEDDQDNVYFVDETEAKVATNRAKGIKSPGWYKYTTYTDGSGATRHKAELLVWVKNTAAAAGDGGAIRFGATEIVANTVYEIVTVGTTDFVAIGAALNTVGTVFTATGVGTGTGVVKPIEDSVVADS